MPNFKEFPKGFVGETLIAGVKGKSGMADA
jgi:hypothetical protein